MVRFCDNYQKNGLEKLWLKKKRPFPLGGGCNDIPDS